MADLYYLYQYKWLDFSEFSYMHFVIQEKIIKKLLPHHLYDSEFPCGGFFLKMDLFIEFVIQILH